MHAQDSAVLIAGAGPTGLMLAGELRLHGVEVVVLERRLEPMLQSRALGFSARAIEEFDQRGLLSRFGPVDTIPIGHFGGLPLDFRVIEGGSYGARGIPQSRTEAILADWATGLGADIRRGHEVVGLETDDLGVWVDVRTPDGPQRLRARYLVGCDGSRSAVRTLAGIDFAGTEPTIEMWLADITGVQLELRFSGQRVPGGMVMVLPAGPQVYRVGLYERAAGVRNSDSPPSFSEVADAFQRLTGEDIHAATPSWVSWFTDASRQASRYRRGPVFLAGDAAHVHLPQGAQGLSGGVGDAVNLGWKLAAAIHGWAPADLLDTYSDERQPVGARVLMNTLAQRILYLSGEELDAMRDLFGELMTYPSVQQHLAGMVSGQDIRYALTPAGDDDPHSLLGRRLPSIALEVAGLGPRTVYQLLHAARPVLLDLADDAELRAVAAGWSDRVELNTATVADQHRQSLEGVGAVLVRPDGYVAWVGTGGVAGLAEALEQWVGQPRSAALSRPGQSDEASVAG